MRDISAQAACSPWSWSRARRSARARRRGRLHVSSVLRASNNPWAGLTAAEGGRWCSIGLCCPSTAEAVRRLTVGGAW
jgi:hypothetical protein